MATAAPTFIGSLLSYLQAEANRKGSGKSADFKAFLKIAQPKLASVTKDANVIIERVESDHLKSNKEALDGTKMIEFINILRNPDHIKFFEVILTDAQHRFSDPLGVFTFYIEARAMSNLRKVDDGNLLKALEYLLSTAPEMESKKFPYKNFAAEVEALRTFMVSASPPLIR